METITFYSYKGGVGRTLTLANVASYLSRFGLNVCIIDFDLEAPGVHYKFPQKVESIKKGLVDYIYNFSKRGIVSKSLVDYTISIDTNTKGFIKLIPAGDVLSSDYWRMLSLIDWHNLFYKEDSEGIPFFIELKEKILRQFNPDFLLIDSRTGISDMSSLCTSILPDKVIFFITNNKENIEGARQILKGIKKVERPFDNNQIDVSFALTRLPVTDEKTELLITKKIRDYINESTERQISGLNIDNICILHSDREIELNETLRIGNEKEIQETTLLGDYLKLFSKVIPQDAILDKINNIILDITSSEKLFSNPDNVQKELEYFVNVYPHYLSLEKLLDFYILRNESKEKILYIFNKIFYTYSSSDDKIINKYKQLFMKFDIRPWENNKFELNVIEKYLKSDNLDNLLVEQKLAQEYLNYGVFNKSLEHYLNILDKNVEKENIISAIFDVYLKQGNCDKEAKTIISLYLEIIEKNLPLKIKLSEVLFRCLKEYEEVLKMLKDDSFRKNLFDQRTELFIEYSIFFNETELQQVISSNINKYIESDEYNKLADIGQNFYRIKKSGEFKRMITKDNPRVKEVIQHLDRRFSKV